jgi:shikimate kinase
MHYFICGFMGAGKSTRLKDFALDPKYFGYSFFDLDQEVLNKHGKGFGSLGELINFKGFDWFRKVEFDTLVEIWSGSKSFTAMGGGTLTVEALEVVKSRNDIEGLYLDTPFTVCLDRIKGTDRPLAKLSESELRQLYSERRKTYAAFKKL